MYLIHFNLLKLKIVNFSRVMMKLCFQFQRPIIILMLLFFHQKKHVHKIEMQDQYN